MKENLDDTRSEVNEFSVDFIYGDFVPPLIIDLWPKRRATTLAEQAARLAILRERADAKFDPR